MKHICSQCIGDGYLSSLIEEDRIYGNCSYCNCCDNSVWPIEKLSDSIQEAFANHYIRTSDEPSDWDRCLMADSESGHTWEREGNRSVDAIQDAANIPSAAAADVQKILSGRFYDAEMAQLGEETEFASGAHYEQKDPDTADWHRDWRSFEHALKYEGRFFSQVGAKCLAAIFNNIDALRTWDSSHVIVEAGPSREIDHLYRARVFQADDNLKEALCFPARHLGPPPSALASAGRMNARGISVFYGAKDEETAVAEVRPPIGSRAVVARFALTRQLRLLDLRKMDKVREDGSVFDPTLVGLLERVAFLRTLGQRMTRPVMPDDEAFDYLPTQAIADFLSTENTPVLDGIIFKSVQFEGGVNVVLFHKAARVAEIPLPINMSIEASTHNYTEDGAEIDYGVREWVSRTTSPKKRQSSPVSAQARLNLFDEEDCRKESLSIDLGSIEVHHVESVKYKCDKYPVSRNRFHEHDLKF